MLDPAVLGIDIGSVSIAAAVVNAAAVLKSDYRFHRGNVRDTLRSVLEELGPVPVRALAFTSSSPCLVPGSLSFDHQVCLIRACRRFFPDARSILHIGGERFGLIRLDSGGAYRGARASSACAAGTGSFLDQQARRLGFPSSAELARRACAGAGGQPPRISTRCAVFARTDLVHAQQEGHSLDEICDGLCKGLAQNIADTVLGGDAPPLPMVFAGGVARNEAVRRHLERIVGAPLLTHKDAPLLGAIGAAICCLEGGAADAGAGGDPITVDPDLVANADAADRVYHYPALAFPDGETVPRTAATCHTGAGHCARHPVEVEIFSPHGPGDVPVRMGIDVGSTSTKAILVTGAGVPVAGFYTRTLGSPLTAVQAICEAVESHQDASGVSFRFKGVAATGAGRKFVGSIVKADLVVDEITAHARAAYALDPRIDTIIEIGGQDAKFTTMKSGMVTFSRMNTVCAAGTGSFLEEQAERLGCETAGGTMDDVTMNNIMLKSWDDYAAMNKVYAEYFPGDKPARWCIVCGLVRPDALVEIGSIAHIGKK